MANEGFFQRWSRLKGETGAAQAPPGAAPGPAAPAPDAAPGAEPALPTLADVARLDAESDYSAFVARGVDATVRRLALKKLFSDPHFKLIDGLDIYMADYNQPDPVSPAMLAALQHAQKMLAPLIGPDDAQPPPSTAADSPPGQDPT